MTIFPLAIKLIPLYCYIFLGYIAGKKLDANLDTIAKLMFFLITPIIVFNGTLNTHLDTNVLSLPLLTFAFSCCMCLLFYQAARLVWQDASKNIMAFSAGSGATGYFGIPLAMIIFTPEKEGLYIMALLGVTLYDCTLGYYISAKGTYTPRECVSKLLKTPTLYAFILGTAINFTQIEMPSIYVDFVEHIKGVYVVFGMMIVGIGIAGITHLKIDYKFVGMTFLAKFLVWPLIIMIFIALDLRYLGIYDHNIHHALTLISIVPIAINTVVMASMAKSFPDKASATVLLSTLFALLYVPFMADFLLN